MNKFALKFLLLTTLTFLVSCGGSGTSKNQSRATGWKINDKEGGFKFKTDYKEQETPPGTVFVEGGTFTMGKVQDDVMHDWNNSPNQQHVQSFYMDETEVTNIMYLEYLHWMKTVFPPDDEQYENVYYGAIPDTLVWRSRLGYAEVMVDNYLRHPAYQEYPVVGVTWVQAVEFARWRTNRVNENILEADGSIKENEKYKVTAEALFDTDTYLASPTSSYGGNEEILNGGKKKNVSSDSSGKYVTRSDGIIQLDYRLPSEAEWEYAALGQSDIRIYNSYRGRKKYPWVGQYTRSGTRVTRGDQMANFKQGDGDYGGIAGWSDDMADITIAVKAYEPNDYGLYDMAGNVAEWVQDVYRPIVDDEFNDFNYYRGSVYTKNKIGDDGKVKIVTVDSIQFDTLANGKIVARALPGEIYQTPEDETETYLRLNYDESNHKNFRDGDIESTRYYDRQDGGDEFEDEAEEDEGKPRSTDMYNFPRHKVYEEEGEMVRKYDKDNMRTSLVSDETRVYKGGSWKDREYWLDPAQRRYLPQDMATDYIGFRCAVSRVGSKYNGKGDHKRPRG